MTDDGGPAFPRTANDSDRRSDIYSEVGMSLRDYFAAACITGLLAADVGEDQWHTYEAMCRQAYNLADDMIAARKAKP